MNQVIQKFTVNATIVDVADESNNIIIDKLVRVSIKNDYKNNAFPLYVFDMMLKKDQIDTIVNNDILISLNVYQYNVETEDSNVSDEQATTPSLNNLIISTICIPYDKPLMKIKVKTDEDNDENNEAIENQLYAYTLATVPKKLLEYNEDVINVVYNNANMNEIAINILSSVSLDSLYIEDSYNKDRLDRLFIPPMSIVSSIKYLSEIYGFYKNRTKLYFDINKTYLYDLLDDNNRIYENSLNVIVQAENDVSQSFTYAIPYIDENNITIYKKNVPSIMSIQDVYNDTTGNKSIFNSYDENFNLIRREYSKDAIANKTRYLWNTVQKSQTEQAYLKSSVVATSLAIDNLGPDYITPLTKITVSSDLDNATGTYSLLDKSYILTSPDYKNYSSTIVLSLAKI